MAVDREGLGNGGVNPEAIKNGILEAIVRDGDLKSRYSGKKLEALAQGAANWIAAHNNYAQPTDREKAAFAIRVIRKTARGELNHVDIMTQETLNGVLDKAASWGTRSIGSGRISSPIAGMDRVF
jgi:hypothetical protein